MIINWLIRKRFVSRVSLNSFTRFLSGTADLKAGEIAGIVVGCVLALVLLVVLVVVVVLQRRRRQKEDITPTGGRRRRDSEE